MVIIAVDDLLAQHLHVNTRARFKGQLGNAQNWSVRVTGDFMIVMNNQLALPVIVRHPQRFNDSRSFMAAFKRQFLALLELSPIPHAKISLIRNAQFATVSFERGVNTAAARYLQNYADLLNDHQGTIDWSKQPSNAELALQLAEETWKKDPVSGEKLPIMDFFEDYAMMNFHLPAHPDFNEHNRTYLYRSSSLNDIMNVVAVNQQFLTDYRRLLDRHGKSDQIIDRDVDVAADYCSFCEANGISPLDDLALPYYYLLHYDERQDENISDTALKGIATGLREFARFMRAQQLFSDDDFSQFNQAVAQGWDALHSQQRTYHLQQLLRRIQLQFDRQRQNVRRPLDVARQNFRVRVELADYFPQMWREFEVSGDTRLDKLCFQVLTLFNVRGNHLFDLWAGTTGYQLPLLDSGYEETASLTKHWLGEFKAGDQLTLNYDFGDSWKFIIRLVATSGVPRRSNGDRAKLLAGFGRGIIEDIGGPTGLTQAAKDDLTLNQPLDIAAVQERWGAAITSLQRHYE